MAAVSVYAYTEALCIDCQRFFQNQLSPTFQKLGPTVIDLHLVPFGNAQLDEPTKRIKCQHGEAECDANLWEQCAVEQATQPMKGWGKGDVMDFMQCLEDRLPMGHADTPFDENMFLDCTQETLDAVVLKSCHDNPYMQWKMQEKYAQATPEHDYVPWIVVNGRKIDEATEDLLEVVCREYVNQHSVTPPEACVSVLKEDMQLRTGWTKSKVEWN